MKLTAEAFGALPDGRRAMLYTMDNDCGMRAEITNYGGCIVRLFVPDKREKRDDIVLGYPSLEGYLENPPYFGALIGRNSGRIAGARVSVAGTAYALEKNDGTCNLHSAAGGLSHRLMTGELHMVGEDAQLVLSHTIEDMGDGFPGNLALAVSYTLTAENALIVDYRAVSDRDTLVNPTNHSYFNLAGHASGGVHAHHLQLNAHFYHPNNAERYPDGEVRRVADTPFDFLEPKPIGKNMDSSDDQIRRSGGYDHNFLLDQQGYRLAAAVCDPASGRVMRVFTDLPAVQFYTGNGLGRLSGKDGAVYERHAGFCLETQFAPNAVHMPWLVSPIVRAGEAFASRTGFHFSASDPLLQSS